MPMSNQKSPGARGSDAVKSSLSVEAWAEAALDALATGGLDAVAVEPLARRLGVTKGSFYWHFPSREALLREALKLWERHETIDARAGVEEMTDPYERIVRLFKQANSSYKAGRLYLALAAASDDPAVGEVVKRVSANRLNYLNQCYRALGLSELDARLWSTFAYATFIGNQQVHRDTPEQFPVDEDFRAYFKLMLKTLVPRPGGPVDGEA
ncbi:TetR/AcrR family transcriptional regulator [Nevskia ramosa]|uniref:TetR/AcrR family transcriptional regulator n=2 Tax=Nevskia TaxID=64001 RepID=UPI0003B3E544|nr:TetR/AcrR family transcriptional regulator [Nevskia ramosa]